MLRWRRFCRHSGIIEQLYPLYKKQVAQLMGEYEDAVQRARRLAFSREKALTGRGNPINAVTQEDMVIYLQWLVCHLHSVKTIHCFLRELQHLPAYERIGGDSSESGAPAEAPEQRESTTQVPGPRGATPPQPCNSANTGLSAEVTEVLKHTVRPEEFGPQLQNLVSHFNILYNVQEMKSAADEMELLGMVSSEFRSIFRKQEEMKTFLVYGSTEATEKHWGKNGSTALKKEDNWTPFIRVRSRHGVIGLREAVIVSQKQHHGIALATAFSSRLSRGSWHRCFLVSNRRGSGRLISDGHISGHLQSCYNFL
ncbi:hypothetical protein SKAU_G00208410 [Synaphobranchus kaupii]|uniref:DUF4549 domain-containing protein n=1 Tax=Synaphobranchus kaupii TaxID=118154 RepID=A0A9Q1F889_SYNKA|nr:hypothetical protein SKAU_G00208410 [Synaphobranchus kaupii]